MGLIKTLDDERLDDGTWSYRSLYRDSLRAALEERDELKRADLIREGNALLYVKGCGGDVNCAVETLVAARDAALSRAEEAERQLCRAREIPQKLFNISRDYVMTGRDGFGNECREIDIVASDLNAALSSSSPCPHEAKVARLTEYADRIHATTGVEITRLNTRIRELEKEIRAKDAIIEEVCEERDRLREERDHYRTLWLTVSEGSVELRRRAKKAGKEGV